MSRVDNCYDNAVMESAIGAIMSEFEMTEYRTIREALNVASHYIRFYNFERKHTAIEYLTSAQFERLTHRSK
ncbi:MAG: transposase [Planctomyces sp.]|nr:transposase [Planctomyces sp.]